MSPREPKSEFRRYRQGLFALTFGVTTLIVAWLLASVAHSLFSHPTVRAEQVFSGRANDLDALLSCQTDVESLFNEVNQKLFDLQALGAHYEIEMAEQWEAFSKRWKARWQKTGARCRFEELSNHGVGSAYDHLAAVYGELEEVQRAYAVLLYNFIDHHASRVDDIRRTLETSRKTFERERAVRGSSHAG